MFANSPLWILCMSNVNQKELEYVAYANEIFLVVLQQTVDFEFV